MNTNDIFKPNLKNSANPTPENTSANPRKEFPCVLKNPQYKDKIQLFKDF